MSDVLLSFYDKITSNCVFNKLKTSKMMPYAIIILTILAIKLPFIFYLDGPTGNTGMDEFGTLATAACMAGKDWSEKLQFVSYYGFGYSVLLVPIFFLFNSPGLIHQLVLVVNALLLGICGIVCYSMVTKFFQIRSKSIGIMISLAVTMFYSSFMHSDYGINETMLVLLVWLVLYALLMLAKDDISNSKRKYLTLALVLIISYSFLINSRMLILPCAVAVATIMYRCQYKKWLVNPWIFIIGVVGGYLLSKWIIEIVQIKFWLKIPGEEMNNSTESLLGALGNIKLLFTYNGFKAFLYAAIGQIYSLFMLSGGLLAIGCIIGCKMLVQHKDNRFFKVLVYFIFSALAATFLLNITISLHRTSEVIVSPLITGYSKWFLYHRYNALFCSPIIMLTIVYLIKYKEELREISILSLLFTAIIIILFFLFVCRFFIDVPADASGVFFSFQPYMNMTLDDAFQTKDFIVLTLVALIFMFFMIYTTANKNYVLTCFLYIGFNFYNYAYVTTEIILPSTEEAKSTYDSTRAMVDLIKEKDGSFTYATNPDLVEGHMPYFIQFSLNEIPIHWMTPKEMDDNTILITSMPIENDLNAQSYCREFKLDENEYWYVRGEKAQEVVEKCYHELFE